MFGSVISAMVHYETEELIIALSTTEFKYVVGTHMRRETPHVNKSSIKGPSTTLGSDKCNSAP